MRATCACSVSASRNIGPGSPSRQPARRSSRSSGGSGVGIFLPALDARDMLTIQCGQRPKKYVFIESPMERSRTELFEHLVGAQEERFWNRQPDGFRGLQIDDKLEISG